MMAGIYSNLHFEYAAKYYVMLASNSDTSTMRSFERHELMISSLIQLHDIDFSTGSWLSAMEVSQLIMKFLHNFEGENLILSAEKMGDLFNKYRLMTHCCKLFRPDMDYLLTEKERHLGWEYNDLDKPDFSDEYPTIDSIKAQLDGQCSGILLNELADIRYIKFYSVKSEWIIYFDNIYSNNVIGEEFCAFLQIFLSNIDSSGIDIVFNTSIKISSDSSKPFIWQVKDVSEIKWYINFIELNLEYETYYKKIISSVFRIVQQATSMSTAEFIEKFRKIQEKTMNQILSGHSYQIIYKQIYTE